MSLLTNVRNFLIAQNAVSASGAWPCYIAYTPDDVDQVVSIEPTGGFPQDTHAGENFLQTFEIRIRAGRLDYATAEAKWYEIFRLLNQNTLSGVNMIVGLGSGPLTFPDTKNRPNLTMNFRTVVPST